MSKVLFLTNTFPSDTSLSSGVFNFNAANQLDDICDLTVIHLRSWRPFRKLIEKKQIKNLNFICFSFPFYPVSSPMITGIQLYLYQLIMRLLLAEVLKEQTLIHSVGASFSGVIGSYLSKKLKIPHIAQCIGTDINITLPKNKACYFYSVMEKYVDIYTTNSFALEKQVQSIYPNKPVKTIYRGVNLDFFKPLNTHSTKLKTNIAFIGGLSYREEHPSGRDYKGGITLLKAWQSLDRNEDVVLHFAGPEVTASLVEEVLGQSPDKLNIKISSYLSRNDVKELFSLADIVVVPSWMEGLPNAGMEALASSCALIGTDVGGLPELIDNNGFLFQPGDYKTLAKLLDSMISDRARLSSFKQRSRELALTKFSSKQFPKLYRELYEKL